MFIINKNQIKVFDTFFYKKFVEDMFYYLKYNFSDLINETDEDTMLNIENLINEAESYEIIEQCYVAEYIELCYLNIFMKKRFKDDNILDILTYPDRNSELKIRILQDYLKILDLKQDDASYNEQKEIIYLV